MPFSIASLASSIGIKGGAIIALALALAICWFGWDRAALQRDVAEGAKTILADRLATSNSSIDRLTLALEAKNEESRLRAETYENSLRIARERANENERRATASNARIARLEAMAGQDGVCQVPEELAELVEGL
jgi:hypothetical protein